MSPRCRSCAPVPPELREIADLLERRWTLGTIYACSSGAARFNEFRQSLPGVSPTTLSERLEQLEDAGIVERRLVPGLSATRRLPTDREGKAAGRGGDRVAPASLRPCGQSRDRGAGARRAVDATERQGRRRGVPVMDRQRVAVGILKKAW